VAGWIKLWRKLIENGHLKMPGTAFKLWIYCLLEAVPYPDYKQNLDAGELWLSYQRIKDNLAEANKNVSKSTISAALKYLEQHGYIKLYPEKFKGIKVKVINWTEYQVLAYSAAAESSARQRIAAANSQTNSAASEVEFPIASAVLEVDLPTTLTAAGSNLPATTTAADSGSPGTLSVLDTDNATPPLAQDTGAPIIPTVPDTGPLGTLSVLDTDTATPSLAQEIGPPGTPTVPCQACWTTSSP